MKQIYNIMVGMALMLGATSCEKEILDNGQAAGIALADGQFIVDYSGEVTTRAIKDNAEKGERINSLTYLLYIQQDNDYVLEKRREIPGLNKNKTDDAGNPVYESWPLTRDNMTWEQREALKDTLIVGSNYRTVFVANADASLWDGTNSPLVGADLPTNGSAAPSYSSAYLQLPEDLAFNDGNMFYLAEAEINGAGQNRNTPYNCPITLKRVVTRTDWWFERLPEYDETNTEVDWKQTEEVKAYSTAMLNSGSEVYWASIINSINAVTESFLSEMITYFDTKGENQEDPEAESYNNYATALTTMKEDLSSSNYAIDVLNAEDGKLFADFFEMLRVACLGNQEIQQRWIASWRKDVYSAQLVYDGTGQRADRLYLDKTTSHEGTTNVSPLMSIDSQEENTLDGYTYDGFHFVGLANPELNQVNQVEIISDTNNTETTINVSATVHTEQGINERYGIYYRPIAELGLEDDWNNPETTEATISKEITCNLATALPFAEDGSQEELKNAMADAMADETATGLRGYGESLNSITLTISLPNLENTAVLKITDSWNMRKID